MGNFEKLGEYLKSKRLEKGLSQIDLGVILGFVSGQFVSNWERGISAPPGNTLQKMISLLKLDREVLIQAMIEDASVEIRSRIYKKERKSRKSS
jgi:transcriptional regulator with XRE-family HTH domain